MLFVMDALFKSTVGLNNTLFARAMDHGTINGWKTIVQKHNVVKKYSIPDNKVRTVILGSINLQNGIFCM
jgi:hypothetical protein